MSNAWLVVVLWCASGVAIGLVAGARGHDSRAFAALGLVFGPLVAPLVVEAARRARYARPLTIIPGDSGGGDVDVLVEHAGNETPALVEEVRLLFGARLRRIVVADVIDYESAVFHNWSRYARRNAHHLEIATMTTEPPSPGAVLVPGRRAHALTAFARREGFDLFVSRSPADGAPATSADTLAASGMSVLVLPVATQRHSSTTRRDNA